MAPPTTEKFEEMVLEVEFDPVGDPGTYSKICGIIDVTINRTANVDTSEVPADCDDESLPLSTERQVRSLDFTISGTGVMTAEAQGKLKEWFYSAAALNVKVTDAVALSGDTEVETGPALLTAYNNERTKGPKVSAEIELQYDGTPTRTPAA